MNPYGKIPTIWKRDPDNNYKTLMRGTFATRALEYLAYNQWEFTEKIDGTNIRVIVDHGTTWKVEFRGRTDRAQIPSPLLDRLHQLFSVGKMLDYSSNNMTLYGEGYGRKIQKGGGNYIPDGVNFILFDVLIDGWWLRRPDVDALADDLGISSVPVVGSGNLYDAIYMVERGLVSTVASAPKTWAEGLVVRPKEQLFDRRGDMVIAKIKTRDFDG